ncbi:MAG: 5'/3'-nucleotidase SurE [Rhodothalassiaceae bacterium]
MTRTVSFERILVCNDDGIHAPGISVLEEIARDLSDEVWVVAPDAERSGAGHSLTLTTPVRVRKTAENRFAVMGTPTDSVMMAVNFLMKDHKPSLLLSGINRGANMAEDVTYSGTIAAAMEGTLAGIPSIALSQAIRPPAKTRWATAKRYAREVIAAIVAMGGWDENVLMNVNFPAYPEEEVKGIRVTEQGRRDYGGLTIEERTDMRGFPYYWFGLARSIEEPGHETDLKFVRDGWISVTPLHLDLTHHPTRKAMEAKLDRTF